ncbi:MAG: hypothetical protein Tsb0024_02500 [Ruegeria sp.]|jgi:hypothetical protein
MLDRHTLGTLASEQDVKAFGFTDDTLPDAVIALLGFQRTKQISKHAREAWMVGNRAPLMAEVVERRSEIFNGALLEVLQEHIPLRRFLAERKIQPRSIVDIGCGQALPTLFLLRDHSPKLTLVDIEHTDEQYHSWARSGSGYSSLTHARDLLVNNGADPREVETLNPLNSRNAMAQVRGDLVTSFYSCGFHYPVDDYSELMVETISAGGTVCLDLRKRYLRRRPAPLDRLLSAGRMVTLYEDPRSYRVVITGA